MEKVDLSTVAARGRLAVLSAHLSASVDSNAFAPVLDASCTSAQQHVAPPPNLKGSLTIIDERTGKSYQVKVSEEGAVKATDLKKEQFNNSGPAVAAGWIGFIVADCFGFMYSLRYCSSRRAEAWATYVESGALEVITALSHDSISDPGGDITTGKNDKGLKLYDPGYLNTAPVRSSICYIDGDEGILRYRGYPIEELAEGSTFLEVSYLLMYGNLPSESQLADWEFAVSQHSAVPQGILDIIQAMPHDAHPMGVLVSAMSALSVFHPDANPALRGQDLYKSKQVRDKQIVRILGKAPTIAAAAYLRMAGRPPVLPSSNLSYSENFLYMLDSLGNRSYTPNSRLARVLDILFILHAEHEMNCSTAAARHLASSGVDVYTALAGAVGALYGPLHGGANEAVLKMLSEIGTIDNIPEFLEGVKNRKRKMSGFGHRVYKNYDPRAKVIKNLAEEVFSIVGRDPLIEVAIALERAALSDEYFVKRKLYPNVDFYSGLIYRAMGFPTEFFPVLFAIPRMAGYLSHWRESLDDPDTKIMRPAQDGFGDFARWKCIAVMHGCVCARDGNCHSALDTINLFKLRPVYTGVWQRHYMPPRERMVSSEAADKLGQVSVSNATRRRLAGSGA
ncbi:hypothetical protein RJ640_024659 [Escallonia rubra]|uniref:Citrate synthase n=1 Tax=Escallonia rubra TaxID=112253 RepID=A0AA88RC87_9ASTE|nr:hypothetical protein RJ640_024659 [Escallonia rubra]